MGITVPLQVNPVCLIQHQFRITVTAVGTMETMAITMDKPRSPSEQKKREITHPLKRISPQKRRRTNLQRRMKISLPKIVTVSRPRIK
jgi:hypothetical protein